jgi:hypothetical protein
VNSLTAASVSAPVPRRLEARSGAPWKSDGIS